MDYRVTNPSSFSVLRPNPQAELRLLCFPYAGGGTAVFRNWLEFFPPSIEVCAAQLPGREMRMSEAPFTRLSPLVNSLVQEMAFDDDIPFAFFGHSMGALISFELARLLRKRQAKGPVQLFLSGRGAPQLPPLDPPMHTLPEPEFIHELRRLNGTPKEIFEHEELMQLMLPIIRADFTVCETYIYTPGPPLDCPLTIFGGEHDEGVPYDRLEAWKEQTSSSISIHTFPGGHFFLQESQSQFLETLSAELRRLLARR